MTATTTPELLTVDPATLEIGDNVRDEVDLDATPEFVESIAEHGVLHPILAERRDDGTILVTDGQRRLLAARAANRTSVPVIIRPQENGTDNARKATRIGQQIVSNDQREALTDGQRAAGIAAMLDLGLSQTAVAKAASVSRTPGDAGCLSDGGLGQAQVEHGGDAGGALAVGEGFALVVGDDLLADASGLAGVVGSVLLGADDDGHAGPVRGAGGEKSALSIGDQDGAVIPAFGQDRVQDTVFCDGLDKLRCRVEVDLVADVVTDLEVAGSTVSSSGWSLRS
ncbi:ParB N-terminal domain-containing protein [Rhodococcus hoagii]|nr:ParB N-terminal domain-containing protein [Prescottella equi]